MGFKKRQLVYIPEVNATSFVLFFENGDTGLSWSIHDYSEWGKSNKKGKWNEEGQFRLYKRDDYRWTADEIRDKALYSFDAPATPTTEHEFWCERISERNRQHQISGRAETKPSTITASVAGLKSTRRAAKEIIDDYFDRSDSTHNLTALHQQATLYRRRKEKAGVSLPSVSRIYNGKYTTDGIREAVAAVINELVPCSRHDLLPPGETSRRKRRKEDAST